MQRISTLEPMTSDSEGLNTLRIGDKMRQWRNGVGNAPRVLRPGTLCRNAIGNRLRVFAYPLLTAAAVAVAMMATVGVTSPIPAYNAKDSLFGD